MKKCPYCAEEIQDEAIYCRYCHKDLVPQAKPRPTGIYLPTAADEPPRRKPKPTSGSVFWTALSFGICMGFTIFAYRLSQPMAAPEYGDSGHFNNAVMGGISSVILYGFLFSLLVFLWRVVIKRTPGVPVFSASSGFASVAAFFVMLALYFMAFTVDFSGFSAAVASQGVTQPTAPTQRSIQRTPTKPLPTSRPFVPYATSVDDYMNENAMRDRVNELYKAGYLTSMLGSYINMPDFDESYAQINWFNSFIIEKEATSFVIRADTSWESASESAILQSSGCGAFFRASDLNNYYLVFLSLDGEVTLHRVQNDVLDATWHKHYGDVGFPRGNAEIMLAVQGDTFNFFVNKTHVLTVTDTKIRGDQFGLTVHSGTNKGFGTRCRMDQVDVWVLEKP